ncbi:MAG: DUF2092 domain-containing protein [Deltaproteobacteria bacterium]|nr:DUF2092 domain-containing protein [Deltaproteobacteria bacterium]MBW2395614.1 DUF2092 domain-containing protein [Deltaproteobacteria bacterium]
MHRRRIGATPTVLLLAAVSWAQVAFTEEELPAVDPAAVAIVREAFEPILAARGIEVRFRTLYDAVQEEGYKLQFSSHDKLRIRRPDRAWLSTARDDGLNREVRYDGTTVSVYDRDENVFGQFAVPDTLDATFDYLELEIGTPLPVADLFYNDLSHLSGAALAGEVVGTSRVGEWACDHVSFRGEVVDWQMWVEQGGERRLRKFVITYHEAPGVPQFSAIFDHWDLTRELPDEIFAFEPPEGAERIPVLARPVEVGEAR